MIFLHPSTLLFLPCAIILGYAVFIGERRLRVWQQEWNLPVRGALFLRPVLIASSCACLIIALARPVWDPRPVDAVSRGQDTVFLVDVSRSMDTLDIQGSSRLFAVKTALLELMPQLAGDRVALVAFAGTTVPTCPLTSDYSFFRQAVLLLDAGSASRGGTLLGDALRAVKRDFSVPGRPLAVWVFTDGGDQESFPVEAASSFRESDISLYIWGVGTLAGGEVPERGVSSSLNELLLQSVASSVPGGAYFGVSAPLWSLTGEYQARHKNLSPLKSSRVVWHEGSWYLVWLALILVAVEIASRVQYRKKGMQV